MTRTQIAHLCAQLDPIFRSAARLVSHSHADDLLGEVRLAYLELIERDPNKAQALAEREACQVHRWATWRARDAVRRLLLDTFDALPADDQHAEEVQWAELVQRGYGLRQAGEYVADEEELHDLFREAAARARAEGLELEAVDLQASYEQASAPVAQAIRQRASGYVAREIGSWAYQQSTRHLQRAA